jgi:hypothetical protein
MVANSYCALWVAERFLRLPPGAVAALRPIANALKRVRFTWTKAKISRPTADTNPPPSTPGPLPPTREQIQALAHAIWKDRGSPEGSDVEIWLEAERQLCVQTGTVPGPSEVSQEDEAVDLDQSDAARIDRELDRIVSPPEQRSPTAL